MRWKGPKSPKKTVRKRELPVTLRVRYIYNLESKTLGATRNFPADVERVDMATPALSHRGWVGLKPSLTPVIARPTRARQRGEQRLCLERPQLVGKPVGKRGELGDTIMTTQIRFLDDLHHFDWTVAAKTIGNDHATLIGLIVRWWISLKPESRWAIESGPANEKLPKGRGRGQCDAILCEGRNALGVVEVEGGRIIHTVDKIGKFFSSPESDLASLDFAILLLYSATPKGRGQTKEFPPAADSVAFARVIKVSAEHPDKPIIVITLDKHVDSKLEPIRRRNQYYSGTPNLIRGFLYLNGAEIAQRTYYPRVV